MPVSEHVDPPHAQMASYTRSNLGLVDAPSFPELDSISKLAKDLFKTSVALVSIVENENDRQFFVSQLGLEEPWASRRETPLSHSFCKHVQHKAKPLVIQDSRKSDLVKDNGAVVDLGVIAYLGAPIFSPAGEALGALCVIDDTPRNWSDQDVATLEVLAQCVSREILLKASLISAKQYYEKLILEQHHTNQAIAMRETISHSFMAPDLSPDERFDELLKSACNALKMETAILTRVVFDQATVLYGYDAKGASHSRLSAQTENVLTGEVISGNSVVHFHDASEVTRSKQVTGQSPQAFIGCPLTLDGAVYGSVEFSSSKPRLTPWSEDDTSMISIVTMLACVYLGLVGKLERLETSEKRMIDFMLTERREDTPNLAAEA